MSFTKKASEKIVCDIATILSGGHLTGEVNDPNVVMNCISVW